MSNGTLKESFESNLKVIVWLAMSYNCCCCCCWWCRRGILVAEMVEIVRIIGIDNGSIIRRRGRCRFENDAHEKWLRMQRGDHEINDCAAFFGEMLPCYELCHFCHRMTIIGDLIHPKNGEHFIHELCYFGSGRLRAEHADRACTAVVHVVQVAVANVIDKNRLPDSGINRLRERNTEKRNEISLLRDS